MKMDEKIGYFEGELDNLIGIYHKKRLREKNKAFTLKILAVVFAASITILLGINISNELVTNLFRNVALALGAVISVLNAVEAFYDHRSLWINSTITYTRLLELKRDLKLFSTGTDQGDLDPDEFKKMADRLDRILGDDLRSWLKMRSDDSSSKQVPKDN